MIGYQIEIVGLGRLDSGLARVSGELESLKPLWETFQSQFHAEETDLFARQPWTPLSTAYAERKRREVGNKLILQYSGDLFESLTETEVKGSIRRINDDNAEFGTDIPYALAHQCGVSRGGRADLPARPPLAEPHEPTYRLIASQYLDSILLRAGFN